MPLCTNSNIPIKHYETDKRLLKTTTPPKKYLISLVVVQRVRYRRRKKKFPPRVLSCFSSKYGILEIASCQCTQFLMRNPMFRSKIRKSGVQRAKHRKLEKVKKNNLYSLFSPFKGGDFLVPSTVCFPTFIIFPIFMFSMYLHPPPGNKKNGDKKSRYSKIIGTTKKT